MSLALLLEKYDVSTEDGLQKALLEIQKEEVEVDEALAGVLSRTCSLEARLRSASQAYTKLGEVKTDAQTAVDMVEKTAELAKDVSAKVRQLDLARSRVAECQRRVHDLIDLQICSAGVEAAIKAHDYETGAAHVARYRSMAPGSLQAAAARGAPDPRAAMARAAATLHRHLVRKFEEAAKKEDEAAVERLFKLFPQIGRAEEGVDLLAKYLLTQAEGAIRRASVVSGGGSAEAAVYADAMTRVLEAGGAAVERARQQTGAAAAAGLLPRALRTLQPAVCAGARRVLVALRAARLSGGAAGGALAAEPVLAELALSLSRLRLYFDFLRRKTEADASSLDEAGREACVAATEKIIAECDLTRVTQDMLAHYLELERYFLEESMSKALKMATPQPGATTSSLVDDVFFIARKVIRRSVSTGSVEGACAVLNEVGAGVERPAAALRRWLRAPPDALPLPPPAADRAAPAPPPPLTRDLDAQRALFLAHVNEAEAGGEWAEQLAAEAAAAAGALSNAAHGRQHAAQCAAGLAGAAAAFRAARDLALAALRAALAPRLHAWADALAAPAHAEDIEEESDASALPTALDTLAEAARAQLAASVAEAVLVAAVTDLAVNTERRILQNRYTREAGLAVERRARRLAAWAGGAAPAARERCARLTQVAALLALERLQHARHALQPAARLAPPDLRDVLARRVDFKIDDIKRLKL
ncbi:conserved oligomeric Golgi complex subunit 4 [Achroia grisella]|uniref:conserved oligomeric Golgi complex subunit 4 n=1 Tax=Achroia grisella TaxID=688607 RepID=UPI0027D2AE8B|nr:conserved oligomeric Golgi complex subunit 4 [Achroia grisella]